MKSKLSVLTALVLLLTSVPVLGGQKVGPGVEPDTTVYFTIQNYFLSPFQLSDYNFLGGGARARGMGGAFLGVSDDASAASWNPAGLSQVDKPQMNLSFSSLMRRTESTSTLESSNPQQSFGDKLKYDNNSISFASVALPFKIRDRQLVGGVFFQRLADIYQEGKYHFMLDSVVYLDTTIHNYVLPALDDRQTGNLNLVNVAVGGTVFKSLSLGVGVDIYAGSFSSNTSFFYTLDPTGLNGYKFHPHIKSDYSGFGLSFGAMYKWNRLRLGGVVKPSFTLKEENDVKLFTDIIESGILLEDASMLASPFFKTDREWKMPTMVGLGGSYQIDLLTVSADLEFRNYSKTEVTYRRNIADPSGAEVTTGGYMVDQWWGKAGNYPPFVPSLGWRNLTQFRIGAEYLINTKYAKVPIRVGFRNDPQLYTTKLDSNQVYLRTDMYISGTDTVYNPAFIQSNHGVEKGSWVNGRIFSFGTGLAWTQVKLDVTLEIARYDDVNKQTSTGRTAFDRGNRKLLRALEQETFSEVEKNRFSRIIVSFTGFF
ncbi:MAG: hypothetical protein WCE90_02110 [Candidatus Zixiibacteriota bacterium]